MPSERDTKATILAAAKRALLEVGYARLSTRKIADAAGVPLSQIHYHFGSKQKLVLALLEYENHLLLARQTELFASDMPLWKRWEQACDYLDDDIESGYVRILQEMTAAGWSDEEIAAAVRKILKGWFDLLAETAQVAEGRSSGLGGFTSREIAALAGLPFLGAEEVMLLGFTEREVPVRSALRKIGSLLQAIEGDR